jgi:hypothetical protein
MCSDLIWLSTNDSCQGAGKPLYVLILPEAQLSNPFGKRYILLLWKFVETSNVCFFYGLVEKS